MENKDKQSKKKRSKKDPSSESSGGTARFEDLAKLTSSEIVEQVKIGLSRIAPLDPNGDEPTESPF